MFDLNFTWVDINCPKCGYQELVQLIDVKSEKRIFCHNCKINILLTDGEASVHTSINSTNSALKELEKTFKNFGK